MIPDQPGSVWRPGPEVHWESWSRNGEVCITGLAPPFPGGVRLASCLTWLLRSFASDCRCTYGATGELAFACTGARMPNALAKSMAFSFDLALRDPRLIRARAGRRGGGRAARQWPSLWLEGSVYEYVVGREPFPPVGTPRRKLLLLAEERQVFVPARIATLGAGVQRAWAKGLDAVSRVTGAWVKGLLHEDEHAFAVNMLVLVHAWPAKRIPRRPPFVDSYQRHERLIAELSPIAEAKGVPVAWHALWRLPPAMTWCEAGQEPAMRYPAVSFAVGVRLLRGG